VAGTKFSVRRFTRVINSWTRRNCSARERRVASCSSSSTVMAVSLKWLSVQTKAGLQQAVSTNYRANAFRCVAWVGRFDM
jgi:hypothetical protein